MRPPRRRILTATERKNLERQLSDGGLSPMPFDITTGGWYPASASGMINPVEAKNRAMRIKKFVEEHSPQDESKAYKRSRDARIAQLEETLKKDTVPRQYVHLKRQDSKDYHKVVSTIVSQLENPQRRAMEDELKDLRRERDPEDPNAGVLTYLREA